MLESLSNSNTRYKKTFGSWGENCLDEWVQSQGWIVYRKNLKMRRGEIDRVYKCIKIKKQQIEKQCNLKKVTNFCIAEIKTIYCPNKERFFSFFTEVGLSGLLKRNQILNLYKYAEILNSKKVNLKQISANTNAIEFLNIYIRFFIVLKMYEGYAKETFFKLQKSYKICLQTKDILILSFIPECT